VPHKAAAVLFDYTFKKMAQPGFFLQGKKKKGEESGRREWPRISETRSRKFSEKLARIFSPRNMLSN
jgi:hypothetical protein